MQDIVYHLLLCMANHKGMMVVVDDEVYAEGYSEPIMFGRHNGKPPRKLNGISNSPKDVCYSKPRELDDGIQTDRFYKFSHELRTTTHSILGFLEMIEMDDRFDKLDKDIKDYVKRAERNADELCKIIGEVLSFVKELYTEVKAQRNGSIAKNISFVICFDCFWCTSIIDFPSNQIKRCINCRGKSVLNFPMGIVDRINLN